MTYIKKEDAQKILSKYSCDIRWAENEINSLPSVNFEEMIKKKINAINEGMNNIYYTPEPITWIEALEELLSNLPK